MIIILHNPHDAYSRQFVQKYGEGKQVISWIDDSKEVADYLSAGNPHPSAFPTVVDTVTKASSRRPSDWNEVEMVFSAVSSSEKQNTFNAAVSIGYPVEGKDYSLSLSKESREAFAQMLTLVQEMDHHGLLTPEHTFDISDKEGVKRSLSVAEFRLTMLRYGLYYKSLWNELNG